MCYSTFLRVVAASLFAEVYAQLETLLQDYQAQVAARIAQFHSGPITPEAAFQLEEDLANLSRELNRRLVELAYNAAEPDCPDELPKEIYFEGTRYRRLNGKTPNRHVATRFGTITLWRYPYRDDRGGEGCVFPLEILLGLVEGATPALADRVARYMAEAGASQRRVLERLRQEHGVVWGVKRLRALTEQQSERMDRFRHALQVARVLDLLDRAHKSRGKWKIVLAVGRDGVSLGMERSGQWRVAAVATVTVYDRRGRRLGTVYLASAPEAGQETLSRQLTELIRDVLAGWEGPMPRLCYVTDAGDQECRYFRTVLWRMRHPREGGRLRWFRIIDYFHAAKRITAMAEALFGAGTRSARCWAARMRKLLLKPGGARRVLLSAAAMRSRRQLSGQSEEEFRRAYNYIRHRTRFMDYHGYRRVGLPIGSGVTEAACKTLVTERMKLSGMGWTVEGAWPVLRLRAILLSGIWDQVRQAHLASLSAELPQTCGPTPSKRCRKAA